MAGVGDWDMARRGVEARWGQEMREKEQSKKEIKLRWTRSQKSLWTLFSVASLSTEGKESLQIPAASQQGTAQAAWLLPC